MDGIIEEGSYVTVVVVVVVVAVAYTCYEYITMDFFAEYSRSEDTLRRRTYTNS